MNTDKEYVAIHYKFNPSGATSVDWYIGKRCNFDCSYCVNYLHDNSSPHVPLENMKRLVEYVFERSGKNVIWSLTGGEPTLNPEFIDLCKYLKSLKSRHISVTTNGSRTTKYFLELFPYLDNITLSLHLEFMSSRAEEYIEKIVALEKYRVAWNSEQERNGGFDLENGHQPKYLLVRFMIYPGQLEQIKSMTDELKRRGVERVEYRVIRPLVGDPNEQMPSKKLDLTKNHDLETDPEQLHDSPSSLPLRVTWDAIKEKAQKKLKVLIPALNLENKTWYSQSEREEIHKTLDQDAKKQLRLYIKQNDKLLHEDYHYNKLNFENKSNFEGWYCWAGSKHLKITPTGDIYIGSCHVGGKRGNIYQMEKGIDLPSAPIRCPKWRCTDNLDLRVPKIKSMEHYHLIRHLVE